MVDEIHEILSSSLLRDLAKIIKEFPAEYSKTEKEKASSLYLFMSWDLVNSAGLKHVSINWANIIIDALGDIVKHIVDNYSLSVNIWRLIGDEIVAYAPVEDISSLPSYVDEIKRITSEVNNSLAERGDLGFKCTLWVSLITDYKNEKANRRYVSFANKIPVDKRVILDFVGVDIDAGFRIAKYSQRDVITVSLELAKLLYETNFDGVMWLPKFELLKGLFNGNPYPIIWIPINTKSNKLASSIPYFYKYKNESTEYCFDALGDNLSAGFTLGAEHLERLCADLDISRKIEYWKRENSRKAFRMYPDETMLQELHCVAVCIAKSTGKILVVKRSDDRTRNPGKWEFGCAKAIKTSNLMSSMRNEYKKDFDVDIDIVSDTDRDDVQPIPFALYQINDSDGAIHKGIICLAFVCNEHVKLDKKKFSCYRWLSECDKEAFLEENNTCLVNDMGNTLDKAFSYIKEHNCVKG